MKDIVWKIIGSISGVSILVTAIYTFGVTNSNRNHSDKEILNTINNIVIPEIRQLHKADSCQTVKLITIEKEMATAEQFKSLDNDIFQLKKNQNIMLKFNEDALKEIKRQREIDELTQRKADMFDELKKKDKLNVTQLDMK